MARSPELGTGRVREEDFYAGFAEYLTEDLEECTRSIPLGGSTFQDKWGTPDMIGIRTPRASDIVKFATEVVSAEIKTDTRNLITAFGQACSYRLFSHRSYLVVPRSASNEGLARLESLCLAVGLGLLLFDNSDAANPGFGRKIALPTSPEAQPSAAALVMHLAECAFSATHSVARGSSNRDLRTTSRRLLQ